MEVAQVREDLQGSNGIKLQVGDKIVIRGFDVGETDAGTIAKIDTKDGLRYSFSKSIIGCCKSKWWNDSVAMCLKKDPTDGLTAWVVSKTANTGRKAMGLSAFPPKADD